MAARWPPHFVWRPCGPPVRHTRFRWRHGGEATVATMRRRTQPSAVCVAYCGDNVSPPLRIVFPPGGNTILVAAEIGTSQRNWLCAPPQPIRWAGLLLPLATRAATHECCWPAQPVAGATGAAECYAATIRIVDPTMLGHNTMWRRNTNTFFLSLMVLRPSKRKKVCPPLIFLLVKGELREKSSPFY
jgi:hypothetical protein